MEFMLKYMLVNANCVMQNISCCPDLMSENTKKITFHEYLWVFHKGKSSCRTENKLCMFIFTIQLAKISVAIDDYYGSSKKKGCGLFQTLPCSMWVFWFQFLNDSLGVSVSEFMLLLPSFAYYSWSVSCFGVQSCLGFCLLVLQHHSLFSVLILFCCCSCFCSSCFLFNF